MTRSLFCALALLCVPAAAIAQQRPLVTEDPETVGAGRMLIEGGFDYGADYKFTASGLEGPMLRVPLIGVSVGLSSIAEVQIDGGFYNRLKITSRDPLDHGVPATGRGGLRHLAALALRELHHLRAHVSAAV